jgi:FkbM family methyltransferase
MSSFYPNFLKHGSLEKFPHTSIDTQITILDIGARDGIGWPWNTANKDLTNIILVEPDSEEADLLKKYHQGEVLACALWNTETELVLNINNSPGTSSILNSNMSFLHQFEDSYRFETKKIVSIRTKTIDGLVKNDELGNIDFVKIDTQGSELAILEGGKEFLKDSLVGLEVEVEFSPIYQDQPLFGDVDNFVRNQLGLELWDIRKTHWKYKQKRYRGGAKGRLIFGDALFLRPLSTLEDWLSDMEKNLAINKVHMLIITTIAYGYLDYANAILKSHFVEKYIDSSDKRILIDHINKLSKSFYPFANGSMFLFRIFNALASSVRPSHHGWGSGEANLGSRKRFFFWL